MSNNGPELLLAGALHASGSGLVMLLNPEQSTSNTMLVTVSDELAAAFVARLSEPLSVEFTDGDDMGHAWQAQRPETITEAALDLLGTDFSRLVDGIKGVSESLGRLYVDGEEIVVVLIDARRSICPQLANIKRISTDFDGQPYMLFEPQQINPLLSPYRVYLSDSGTWL